MGLLRALAGLFGDGLAGQLRAAYEAKLRAENDAARLAAEANIAQLEAARAVRLATADAWEMRLVTFLIAGPLALHLALVCFVSAFPQVGWTVHALPAPMNSWQGTIVLSFFGLSAARTAVRGLTLRR